jgi:hypothetical protein
MVETRKFRLRYVGARFEGTRMPLDVLPDLPAFRDLLVSYVKAGWRDAHTNRERLPKGFVRGLKFDLVGIEDGSAVPAIEWDSDNAQLQLPDFRDEIEVLVGNAFNQVVQLVDGAASETTKDSLNPDELRALNRFGSALEKDERIEFVDQNGADGKVVYLDAYRRKRLLTRGRNSYEVRFDSVGKLLGSAVDEAGANGHIDISTSEHGVLWLPLSPDRVKDEFDGKIDADVQFRLMIELDEGDRFLRVADVLEIDVIDAKVVADLDRCRNRIGALSSLADGWHDGAGKSPTLEATTAALRLLARNPSLAEHYRIFPTDAGGVLFEFAKEGWNYSVEIGPDARVEVYGVETNGDGEMETGVLDFDGQEFRTKFDEVSGGRS